MNEAFQDMFKGSNRGNVYSMRVMGVGEGKKWIEETPLCTTYPTPKEPGSQRSNTITTQDLVGRLEAKKCSLPVSLSCQHKNSTLTSKGIRDSLF